MRNSKLRWVLSFVLMAWLVVSLLPLGVLEVRAENAEIAIGEVKPKLGVKYTYDANEQKIVENDSAEDNYLRLTNSATGEYSLLLHNFSYEGRVDETTTYAISCATSLKINLVGDNKLVCATGTYDSSSDKEAHFGIYCTETLIITTPTDSFGDISAGKLEVLVRDTTISGRNPVESSAGISAKEVILDNCILKVTSSKAYRWSRAFSAQKITIDGATVEAYAASGDDANSIGICIDGAGEDGIYIKGGAVVKAYAGSSAGYSGLNDPHIKAEVSESGLPYYGTSHGIHTPVLSVEGNSTLYGQGADANFDSVGIWVADTMTVKNSIVTGVSTGVTDTDNDYSIGIGAGAIFSSVSFFSFSVSSTYSYITATGTATKGHSYGVFAGVKSSGSGGVVSFTDNGTFSANGGTLDISGDSGSAWTGATEISGNVSFADDYVIPANDALTVHSGATLTIPAGLTLTNGSNGTVTNSGDIMIRGAVVNNGTYTASDSGYAYVPFGGAWAGQNADRVYFQIDHSKLASGSTVSGEAVKEYAGGQYARGTSLVNVNALAPFTLFINDSLHIEANGDDALTKRFAMWTVPVVLSHEMQNISVPAEGYEATASVAAGKSYSDIGAAGTSAEIKSNGAFTVRYLFNYVDNSSLQFVFNQAMPAGTTLLLMNLEKGWNTQIFYCTISGTTASIQDFKQIGTVSTQKHLQFAATSDNPGMIYQLIVELPHDYRFAEDQKQFSVYATDGTASGNSVTVTVTNHGTVSVSAPSSGVPNGSIATNIACAGITDNSVVAVEMVGSSSFPDNMAMTLDGEAPYKIAGNYAFFKARDGILVASGLPGGEYSLKVSLCEPSSTDQNYPVFSKISSQTQSFAVIARLKPTIYVTCPERVVTASQGISLNVTYAGDVPDGTELVCKTYVVNGTSTTEITLAGIPESFTSGTATQIPLNGVKAGAYIFVFQYGGASYRYTFVVTD